MEMNPHASKARPRLSIVILNYNSGSLLVECIDSVMRDDIPCTFEVIVPDNHGRIRPENIHWRPFMRRGSIDLPGWYTSLRSFRWSYYQTLIDQLPLLFVLGHAAELAREAIHGG